MSTIPTPLRQLAQAWRNKAARIETRPDAKSAPEMIKCITSAFETCAEELEEVAERLEKEGNAS